LYPLIGASLPLGEDVSAATNTCDIRVVRRVTVSSVRVLSEHLHGPSLYPHIVAVWQLSEDVTAASITFWRRRLLCGPCMGVKLGL
jgi:hypothetical protein